MSILHHEYIYIVHMHVHLNACTMHSSDTVYTCTHTCIYCVHLLLTNDEGQSLGQLQNVVWWSYLVLLLVDPAQSLGIRAFFKL